MDLLPGDVLLVHGKGLVDGTIQFAERRRYYGWLRAFKRRPPVDSTRFSHVAVHVGGGYLIEALAKGLTLSPLTKYSGQDAVVRPLALAGPSVTPEQREALVSFAYAQLGRHDHYGWLSIVTIFLHSFLPNGLNISWDGALICSAFAGQCWEHAGITLATRSSLDTMPSDIARMTGMTLEPHRLVPETVPVDSLISGPSAPPPAPAVQRPVGTP